MTTKPYLTRAESELMQLLWKHGACTVQQLLEGLGREVAYTTVLTTVRILEQKGYVKHEPNPDGGRAHVYKPAVAETRVRKRHVADLVDRLFGGKPQGLVAGLIEDESLSRDELEELKKRIDEKLKKKERS